jgi:hypothetical protein
MRNFLTKYYSIDRMKEDEIGSGYSTYGDKGNASRVLVGKTAEREDLESLGLDDSIILKWIRGGRHTLLEEKASLIRLREAFRDFWHTKASWLCNERIWFKSIIKQATQTAQVA